MFAKEMQIIFMEAGMHLNQVHLSIQSYTVVTGTLKCINMYIVKILVLPGYFLRDIDIVTFNLHFKVQLSLVPLISSQL